MIPQGSSAASINLMSAPSVRAELDRRFPKKLVPGQQKRPPPIMPNIVDGGSAASSSQPFHGRLMANRRGLSQSSLDSSGSPTPTPSGTDTSGLTQPSRAALNLFVGGSGSIAERINQAITEVVDGVAVAPEIEEEEEPELWFAEIKTKIVGTQHYGGIVSDGENVLLRRNPNNQYDPNAVQVLNIRHEVVGHIPKEIAAKLSPIMLAGVKVEGKIPRGSANTFSIPVVLDLYATMELIDEHESAISRLSGVSIKAARGTGTSVRTRASTPGARDRKYSDRDTSGELDVPKQVEELLEQEIDSMYDRSRLLTPAPDPSQKLFRATLYPHQRIALRFLLDRERDMDVEDGLAEQHGSVLPPPPKRQKTGASAKRAPKADKNNMAYFWIKKVVKGQPAYLNMLTNSAFSRCPKLPRGGILADDMGLGKTISTLALMAVNRGLTLVVCPLSVMAHWKDQIEKFVPSFKVYSFHGPDRSRKIDFLKSHDVILTTYNIIATESQKGVRNSESGRGNKMQFSTKGLFEIVWHRIVLDEAHNIKNRNAKTSKAIATLKAERRWCLTGTPIQNSLDDIYGLARFLKLEPLDNYELFNKAISRPMKEPGGKVQAIERLKVLLRYYCLRRTQESKMIIDGVERPIISLPNKTILTRKIVFNDAERKMYTHLFNFAAEQVRGYFDDNSIGRQSVHVLDYLVRLRMLCCDRTLLPDALRNILDSPLDEKTYKAAIKSLGKNKQQKLLSVLQACAEDDCSICLEPNSDIITKCEHVFHRACIEKCIKEAVAGSTCPLCRAPLQRSDLFEQSALEEPDKPSDEGDEGHLSSKVAAILNTIKSVAGKKDPHGVPHKVVVFSQFTTFLKVLKDRCDEMDIVCEKFQGSMSQTQRTTALRKFQDRGGDTHVLFCSLKAGGVGISMTSANYCILADPWWNPAMEDQAIGRLHRLGQNRPVHVLRFIMKDTVEEMVEEMHTIKRNMTKGTMDTTNRDDLKKLQFEMMKHIFKVPT